MSPEFDPNQNYRQTQRRVGYVPRTNATADLYSGLGFKCGLEIHQQLKTDRKLFCRCPAGIYHDHNDFDAEVIRHMRPTLSELGEYDGTALMEFKTRKNIVYRIKYDTACTYEIDDTPPFTINREALEIAIEIALLLKTNVVGELHITRKQYLDGSIPTGFQRTAIVGIEGRIPLKDKPFRIIQLSIEEDSCREVSDIGHWRVFNTDRLGMPLIETVTYPDMTTPDEAAEAGHYLRFLARSSGKVRTGIGAARQDVNVSIKGGTRVEIKGVAHISRIPALTHNEAFRQKALLEIKKTLEARAVKPDEWSTASADIGYGHINTAYPPLKEAQARRMRLAAVNLPGFLGILSFFTQPGKTFADELSDRLKVIACLEKPNMFHSEPVHHDSQPRQVYPSQPGYSPSELDKVRNLLGAGPKDAQVIVWGEHDDVETALETIDERCRLALQGVPNETRKALPDGTTIFERVLPGPNRMYPDTDSAPIPIEDTDIDEIRQRLAVPVHNRLAQLKEWRVPKDTYHYLLKRNLVPVMEKIVRECAMEPRFIGTLFGHTLRNLEGKGASSPGFSYNKVYGLVKFLRDRKLHRDILKTLLAVIYEHPNIVFDSVLTTVDFKEATIEEVLSHVPALTRKFDEIKTSTRPGARTDWIMGHLRTIALGNVPLKELKMKVEKEIGHD